MSRGTKHIALAVATAAALFASTRSAGAQSDSTGHWRFGITPYLWAMGLSGQVGVGPVASNVDIGFPDLASALKFGIMGSVEARRSSWVILADGIYARLGEERVLAFRGETGSLELKQSQTIIQPTAGYTIGDNRWGLDLLGGFRYWDLGTSLNVDRPRASNERSASRSWFDATGGFRFRWVPMRTIRLVAAADGGGGGSRSTGQWYGSLDADPWSYWSVGVAYRWLAVDYDHDNFLYDTHMQGFIFGATYTFR